MKLDIETYRTKRAALNIQTIHDDMVEALSNPHNIALWKQGVENPSASDFSDAFAHFHGFRNVTIDRAATLAQTSQDRFIANKVENVLDPNAVQTLVNSFGNLDEVQVQQKVREFVQQRFTRSHTQPQI